MEKLLKQVEEINTHSLTLHGCVKLARDIHADADTVRALRFATKAHHGITRKYVGVPYISHCLAVASIVKLVGGDANMLQAALLHDTVEDCDVENVDIVNEFGNDTATLVEMLTDVEDREAAQAAADAYKASAVGTKSKRIAKTANRIKRETLKRIDREHTALASPRAQTIKLADLIHNSFSIVEHDKPFAKIYLPEKALLLPLLTQGNAQLHELATNLLKDGLQRLDNNDPHSAAASMSAFL